MTLRIAYVLKSFPKLSETFIAEELAELRRRGVELLICALKDPQEEHVHSLVAETGLLDLVIRDPDQFRGALEAFRPDLIHAHFATEPTRVARELARELELPFTFTAHGHDVYRKPPADFGERAADAERVITVSQANATHIRHQFDVPADKLAVIPCGVDVKRFSPGSDARQEVPTIVCVARFSPVKNLTMLVQVCGVLRDRGLPFRCLLVGDGRTRGEIEQARAELGLESELQLLGALPQSEVIGCWRQADVGVLCSHSEGMPVSLMEAAACGVPVVATDVGGISELVEQGKTGFVVPPGDVNAMADALERVLTSRASIAGDPCETRVTSRASIAGDPCETRVTSRASIAGDPCETRTSRELATEMSWNARLRALSVLSIQHQVDSLTSVWEASIAGERQMA